MTASSSLVLPAAINRQNSCSTSRRTGGLPGERIAGLPVTSAAHPRLRPTLTTFLLRVLRRPREPGNYTSAEFARTISDLGMRQAMGRTEICYDNAMAESFFVALKNERVHRTVYPTRARARADITRYIEFWHNPRRLHSSLDYKSPQKALNEWTEQQVAA